MAIENGYTSTIEAQRDAIKGRDDMIKTLMDDNITKDRLINHLTELDTTNKHEIAMLKRVLERSANIFVALFEKL